MSKISIRFFDDREVQATWDQDHRKWWFSVADIVAVLTDQDDYAKARNYWKHLKSKLTKENSQLVSATNQLKLLAADGKRYNTDVMGYNVILKCVDWSRIAKNDYRHAMVKNVVDSQLLKVTLERALTEDIHSPHIFMKGIDYSYYYAEN